MTSLTDLSLLQLLLANLALAAGSCLQGIVGYGIGTLAAPLLFLISPSLIPAVLILNAVILTVLLTLRNHQGMTLGDVKPAVWGSLVGTALGALTLTQITGEQFEWIFGLLILLAVGLSVAGIRPPLTRLSSLLAGAASGFMGTITAVGGPPIALIYQNQKGPQVRANMSAFFTVSSVIAVVGLLWAGYLGTHELILVGLTFPGVLLGFYLSGHLVQRLRFEGLRPLILGIAAVAGLSALIRGLI
ncbi:sulfite exporter TauE/SafE family protein [Marinobacteraceae bacterium S3BR75-40.1]